MLQIKNIIKFILAILYAGYLLVAYRRQRKVIIYYHGVLPKDRDCFRKQINYLAKNYKIIHLSEILCDKYGKYKNVVAITFDDAFENLIDNALPILEEKGVPAAIFVPTGNMGDLPRWDILPECLDSKEKVMSIKHLVQLDKAGYEIYSHTITHPRLSEIEKSVLRKELIESKKELERILGHTVNAISYPHGSCNSMVFNEAKNAGYEFGYTIEPEIIRDSNNRLSLPRVSISLHDSMFVFKLKLSGAYGFKEQVKKIKSFFKKIL